MTERPGDRVRGQTSGSSASGGGRIPGGLSRGVSFGAGAYVVGVLLSLVSGGMGLAAPGGLRDSLISFYTTHLVGVRAGGETMYVWDILARGGNPIGLGLVLTVGTLIAAGYVLVKRSDSRPQSGFRAGAKIMAGYLPLVVVGYVVILVSAGIGGPARVGGGFTVEPITSILFAGIVFPVLFGGIGGRVAAS